MWRGEQKESYWINLSKGSQRGEKEVVKQESKRVGQGGEFKEERDSTAAAKPIGAEGMNSVAR